VKHGNPGMNSMPPQINFMEVPRLTRVAPGAKHYLPQFSRVLPSPPIPIGSHRWVAVLSGANADDSGTAPRTFAASTAANVS